MKYCWSIRDRDMDSGIAACGAGGIVLMIALFSEAFQHETPSHFVLICGLLIIPLVLILFAIAFVGARQYKIDSHGMDVHYPFGIRKSYSWDMFSEIALCKIHYATSSTAHVLSIRCVLKEERTGPKVAEVGKEKWSTMGYGVLHAANVVSVYYTRDRYEEFLKYYPHTIADYSCLPDCS